LQKINNATADLYGYTGDLAPQFKSTQTAFYVVLKNMNYDLRSDGTQVSTQVTAQDERLVSLIEYCSVPRTRDEMQQFYGVATREYFRKNVLKPLLQSGQLVMTVPDKPNSRNQKYMRV